ncbi:hypothetical protein DY218_29440 [Streptomyces triticagri]|uniref:Regulatory protein n=1 Tax=Streptomyces triticagri TaxID=2293568 RepID=A0A372LXW7_9ACTN|nr:hypothetical protein [Streptomyces triticagri]RFU83113.1 hypothetical protein DY218_29440 [Streptomyces triticagri]
MSEVQLETSGVQAQYAAQVAADLEANVKEQERIGGELAALQEQLAVLERDRAVLVSVREALVASGAPGAEAVAQPSAEVVQESPAQVAEKSVPTPRRKSRKSTAGKAKASEGTSKKTSGKAVASRVPKARRTAKKQQGQSGPTLVELIGSHLTEQREPRSAAEVTTALTKAHPDRSVKVTVVRTTLEGLVAKGRAQRTKQGSSVFYTAGGSAAQ